MVQIKWKTRQHYNPSNNRTIRFSIALVLVSLAVLQIVIGNYFFAIFLILVSAFLALYNSPHVFDVAVVFDDDSVTIGDKHIHADDILKFRLITKHNLPILQLQTKSLIHPFIEIEIPFHELDQVKQWLVQHHISQDPQLIEPFYYKIAKLLEQ